MKIQDAIDTLKRKNGTLNTRFLSEKYIEEFGLRPEAKILLDNGIKNPQDIYDFENSTDDNCPGINGLGCPDLAKRRFIHYKNGYVPHCKRCGNWRNQEKAHNKRFDKSNPQHVLDKYKIDVLKIKDSDPKYHSHFIDIIKENLLLNTNGKIEGQRINQKYFDNRGLLEAYNLLMMYDINDAEGLYRYENNDSGLCECGTPCRFKNYSEGYIKQCEECYWRTHNKLRHVDRITERFGNTKLLGLDDTYEISGFCRDSYINKEDITLIFNHSCGHTYERDSKYQGAWHCPKCFSVRSKEQYEIFDFINTSINDEVLYDERKTLNGLELDIYVPERKFAIEYDGIAFHSFGKSNYGFLNNASEESLKKDNHLIKTEMCEDLGIQLFHVFCSDNQEIWKSMISNKLGLSRKIPGRKTIVKEVPNKEAQRFQELNHLQGSVNASIKLGLYYNDELVSLMTFGKSRYTKTAEYELIRFCSKLNTTVQGGASKLLKYFERNYSPKSIVSYANRRWSTGNLYKQLGFDLSHISKPNYFYFKINENILESRVKFQKHKLSKILEKFDPSKTETENMYENNYRKIYDSGNLVFVKEF